MQWWRLVTKYTANYVNVTSSVTIGTVMRDLGSFGLSLTDSDIQDLITANMAAGTLPGDPADVYFVLTGPSVDVTGFCSTQCGYHSQFLLGSSRIVYGHVGNPHRNHGNCPSMCEVSASPLSLCFQEEVPGWC